MSISLRLSQEDTMLIKSYAALHNVSISELFRQAVMEKIEDEYDLQCYEKAMKAYNERIDFKELLYNDGKIMNILTKEKIDDCFSLDYYLKNVNIIFKRCDVKIE